MSGSNIYYPNLDNSDGRNLLSQNNGGERIDKMIKPRNNSLIDINETTYYQSKVNNNNNKLKCEDTIPEKKTDTSEELINDLLDYGEKLTAKNKKLETENQKLQEQNANYSEIIKALNENVKTMQFNESILKSELNKVSEGSLNVCCENENLSNKLKCSQDEIFARKLAHDDLTKENKKLNDKIKMLNDTISKSNLKSENDELKLKGESEQPAAKSNYDSFIAKIILAEEHESLRCFVAISGCSLGLTYTILPFAISTMGMFMMGFGVLFLVSSALLIYGSMKERLDKCNDDDEKTTKKNFWCKKLSGLILGIGLVLLGIVGLVCPGLFLSYMWSQIVSDIFYSVSIVVGAYLLKCFCAIKIREYQKNQPQDLRDKDGGEKSMSSDKYADYPTFQELQELRKLKDTVNYNIVNNNIDIPSPNFLPRPNSELLDNLPKVEYVPCNRSNLMN